MRLPIHYSLHRSESGLPQSRVGESRMSFDEIPAALRAAVEAPAGRIFVGAAWSLPEPEVPEDWADLRAWESPQGWRRYWWTKPSRRSVQETIRDSQSGDVLKFVIVRLHASLPAGWALFAFGRASVYCTAPEADLAMAPVHLQEAVRRLLSDCEAPLELPVRTAAGRTLKEATA